MAKAYGTPPKLHNGLKTASFIRWQGLVEFVILARVEAPAKLQHGLKSSQICKMAAACGPPVQLYNGFKNGFICKMAWAC